MLEAAMTEAMTKVRGLQAQVVQVLFRLFLTSSLLAHTTRLYSTQVFALCNVL